MEVTKDFFTETKKKLTLENIRAFEKKYSFKLPLSYIDHLLQYNGGKCSRKNFSFFEKGKNSGSSVEWFLAIHDGEYNNLAESITNLKIDQYRMPDTLIPIASDSFGNFVCIDNVTEKIYFWDHETEPSVTGNPDMWSNVYLVADSLDKFFESLITDEEFLAMQKKLVS